MRYHRRMFRDRLRTPFIVAFLAVAAGACEAPQSGTIATPLPGQQTERFPNGDLYVGQMAGGLREGQGTYSWSDGRRYAGTFHAGLQEGRGTYTYPNGEKYDGQFQANRRTGQGTYVWTDGRKYVGEFRDDRPDGRGTYSWPDGKKYVGEFKLGAASGQGTYTWPDGRKYVGELRDDQPNGQGTFTLANGRQQVGQFRNGEYVGAAQGGQGSASGDPNLVRVSASPGASEVPLQRRGGTYVVAVEVNGQAPLDFHIDSGAADVSVPAYVFLQMKSAGSVRGEDMLGSETYVLGNGTTVKAETFRIRTLKVGPVVVHDVRAAVSQYAGPPLLGMSFLGRFNSWSVDNGRGVLDSALIRSPGTRKGVPSTTRNCYSHRLGLGGGGHGETHSTRRARGAGCDAGQLGDRRLRAGRRPQRQAARSRSHNAAHHRRAQPRLQSQRHAVPRFREARPSRPGGDRRHAGRSRHAGAACRQGAGGAGRHWPVAAVPLPAQRPGSRRAAIPGGASQHEGRPEAPAGQRRPAQEAIGRQIGARLDGLQPNYQEYKTYRRGQRKVRLDAALQQRSMARAMSPTATPFAPAAMSGPCGGASTNEDISFDGLFDFVMRNFHYRYVNVHDYITEYSASPVRKVDIMITQIIDYDWPLGDQRTHSSLHDQVKVMERIMKLTNGRVLNFAPFCPFKQVAHNRGYRNDDGSAVDNPLAIVQDAVLNRGHIGVKMYPPMGFMPYDNEGLQRRNPDYYWDRTPVRKPLPDATLGRELDDALDALYRWCLANEVPVMAHTSPGNAADCRYLTDIMVPESWAGVVQRYPGLRVNFAHFGHTDIVANSGHNAGVLMGYMTEGRTAPAATSTPTRPISPRC